MKIDCHFHTEVPVAKIINPHFFKGTKNSA